MDLETQESLRVRQRNSMKRFAKTLTAQEILQMIGGHWQGDMTGVFASVSEPADTQHDSIIFCEQEKLIDAVLESSAGLIITNSNFSSKLGDRPHLIVDKPYFSFMTLVSIWLMMDSQNQEYGIHSSAVIDSTARFEGEVAIGANVVIGANCVLGKGVVIAEGCSLADNVCLGAGTKLYPNVCIYEGTSIGKKCIIHSGSVIGADGFGYLLMGNVQQKIPQVGNVVIEDDVEIGANTTIDRATLGSTRIGKGTKIDNLVQIGHNCVIGCHSILCAQVGLAGSTIVGDYVYLAGQVGVAGHTTIGNKAMVGAQSGVVSSVEEGAKYFGSPAIDANSMKRQIVAQKHLPEIYRAFLKQQKEESGNE